MSCIVCGDMCLCWWVYESYSVCLKTSIVKCSCFTCHVHNMLRNIGSCSIKLGTLKFSTCASLG